MQALINTNNRRQFHYYFFLLDIAIGAYLSGHVVLLRSRPVITIYQGLISFAQHLEFKTKSFQMRECYWYQLDQMHPGKISVYSQNKNKYLKINIISFYRYQQKSNN